MFNSDLYAPNGCAHFVDRRTGGLMIRLDDRGYRHMRPMPIADIVDRALPLRMPTWAEAGRMVREMGLMA